MQAIRRLRDNLYYQSRMKLDSKEKYERIRRFMGEVKLKTGIEPFLVTEDITKFGIYDFAYINKNPSSFAKIQKKLKDSKYDQLAEFTEDLKQVFIAVSDYLFEDDPLQATVQAFKTEIDRFADKFSEDFRTSAVVYARPKPQIEVVPKKAKEETSRPTRAQQQVVVAVAPRATNIRDKLQMLFLLRANENNEAYIRSIGSAYEIGSEEQEHYVITLDNKNTCWMQFLTRQQQ